MQKRHTHRGGKLIGDFQGPQGGVNGFLEGTEVLFGVRKMLWD